MKSGQKQSIEDFLWKRKIVVIITNENNPLEKTTEIYVPKHVEDSEISKRFGDAFDKYYYEKLDFRLVKKRQGMDKRRRRGYYLHIYIITWGFLLLLLLLLLLLFLLLLCRGC